MYNIQSLVTKTNEIYLPSANFNADELKNKLSMNWHSRCNYCLIAFHLWYNWINFCKAMIYHVIFDKSVDCRFVSEHVVLTM